MEPALVLTVVALAALAAAGAFAVRRVLRSAPTRASERPFVRIAPRTVAVRLDLEAPDPDQPAVQRLMREAARRALAVLPDVHQVEIRSRGGVLLGRIGRKAALPRTVALPPALFEPHRRPRVGPDLAGHLGEDEPPLPAHPAVRRAAPLPPEPPVRPIADRFDLPDGVRKLLRAPDDPVEVVRAILEAAGIRTDLNGDLIRTGDLAIVVLGGSGPVIGRDAANHAFIRISRSGAPRGLVVATHPFEPRDLRRRERLAPHVLHVGPDGIQRMADAVGLGADPLRFTEGPPLLVA